MPISNTNLLRAPGKVTMYLHHLSAFFILLALASGVIEMVVSRQMGALTTSNNSNKLSSYSLTMKDDDLDLVPAESAQQQQFTSPTSHEILASGWPTTSPVWPSVETEQSQGTGQQQQVVEPFIFADKPSKQDYSLLLSVNKTLIDSLMGSRQVGAGSGNKSLSASLSFEYYFNHDPKVDAPPGIKIELDRKEFDYLEPAAGPDGAGADQKKQIRSKMWTRHSSRIELSDAQQLDKPDWLKLSLVNRKSPSLVAIRRLRVEFSLASGKDDAASDKRPEQPATPSGELLPEGPQGPAINQPGGGSSTAAQTPPQVPPAQTGAGDLSAVPPPPPQAASPSEPLAPGPEDLQRPPLPVAPEGELEPPNQGGQPELAVDDQVPAASEALTSTIKPVQPAKKKGFMASMNPFGRRRRKRQATSDAPSLNGTSAQQSGTGSNDTTVVLTCYQSSACEHWRAEPSAGQIEWSLGRMPPSTGAITLGYYYASNRQNYGDATRPLFLWLNQTETATIVDQAADHCVDLALYVTERTRLKLYKAIRAPADSETAHSESDPSGFPVGFGHDPRLTSGAAAVGAWKKSSLLLSWAPTTSRYASGERAHLDGARLAAADQNQGWTLETLCFGDFFERARNCGLGECALAFEMSLRDDEDDDGQRLAPGGGGSAGANQQQQQQQQPQIGASELAEQPGGEFAAASGASASNEAPLEEQVVGVALLRQYATSVPNKQAKPAPKWLETWARPEVEPTDNWRLYPKLDYVLFGDNVSLVNMYDGARYSLQSDWLQMSSHLDFGASFLIELLDDEVAGPAGTANQTAGQAPGALGTSALHSGGGGGEDAATSVFKLKISRRIVSQKSFETIYALNTTIDWYEHYNNATKLALFNMSLANLSELILFDAAAAAADNENTWIGSSSSSDGSQVSLFKMIIDIILDCHTYTSSPDKSAVGEHGVSPKRPLFRLALANLSMADRCFPSPCQFGACAQNGTAPDDWQCQCDAQHRGRRCEFGRWCQLAHVAPPAVVSQLTPNGGSGASSNGLSTGNQAQQAKDKQPKVDKNLQFVLPKSQAQSTTASPQPNQAQQQQQGAGKQQVAAPSGSVTRITGKEFCQRKLGAGSKCSEIDLPLDDKLYFDENETFACSCQDDYYLSDDRRCRQAHQCHSIVCPHIGQICDESRPFNRTQPCHCNEKQDWYSAATVIAGDAGASAPDKTGQAPGACIRRQCHDKKRDCGFDAHVCLPTVPGERPICKCGPKFTLKQQGSDAKGAQKYCQSTACVLPTLNNCQHICAPNDTDLERPYTCSCHAGYTLAKDGASCKPTNQQPGKRAPVCRPACNSRTQICTELGCKCRQGYVAEGEVVVQQGGGRTGNSSGSAVNYVQSVRCLNVCTLSYAENKLEFERIETVCPLGLCEPASFACRCFDPNSSALVHTKYEPIWADDDDDTEPPTSTEAPLSEASDDASGSGEPPPPGESNAADGPDPSAAGAKRRRASPLCHLRRVCKPGSAGYQLCRARGAICVPDYTKAAMFDCLCPPSSEKRPIGAAGDFQCEPRCSSVRQECLKKQAACRPIDKNQVRCDCLPGMMLDKHDERCYLAHYTYAMNIIIVNKYYEPESRFHKPVQALSSEPSGGNATSVQESPASVSQAELANEALHQLVPQFQRAPGGAQLAGSLRSSSAAAFGTQASPMFITDYNQCNLTALLPKAILEDPYEHDMGTFLQYMDQCNEKIHQNARTYNLNSKLAEDLRQSMRQHLRDFTVTTNNSLCLELPRASAMNAPDDQISYLNCTIYLQSMEPIDESTVSHVFTNCDKHGADERFCWVKPRLLLMKLNKWWQVQAATSAVGDAEKQVAEQEMPPMSSNSTMTSRSNPFRFTQVVACDINKFCGEDAYSLRLDDKTSLCSCKCPPDIEMIDLKELEPRMRALVPFIPATGGSSGGGVDAQPQVVQLQQQSLISNQRALGAIKEICAPRNLCGANSSFCSFKIGSVCQYDIRTGSRCNCVYPSYENNEGRCVEITFSQLDNTLIVILILVGTCLIVSIALNLYALARSKRGFLFFSGHRNKQYPMSEFTSSSPATRSGSVGISHRHPDDDDDVDAEAVNLSAAANNRRHFNSRGSGSNNNNNNAGRDHRTQSRMNRSTGMPNMAFDPND